VCGLEVACHPCQGYVTVKTGYALSPCGDDIIVCNEETVDVCGLIKQCRDDVRWQWDCEPAWPRPDPNSRDLSEEWVLYLCYDEKPSRGITALRGSSGAACCSRCSGGGSAHCGCGCHAQTNSSTQTAYRPATRTTALQCEPTVTCEGYTFQIRKVPQTSSRGGFGAMVNRMSACLSDLVTLNQELHVLHNANLPGSLNAMKAKLRAFLDEHAIQNCALYQKVQDFQSQDMTGGGTPQRFPPLLVEFLKDCVCSALLPPCPGPVEDNCVPLATVTVNNKDGCRIERICNWEQRRTVITFPNLEYWFEVLLRQSSLTDLLTGLCCMPVQVPGDGGATRVDLLSMLFEEAVQREGQVPRSFVYQQLGSILKGLLSTLTGTS